MIALPAGTEVWIAVGVIACNPIPDRAYTSSTIKRIDL